MYIYIYTHIMSEPRSSAASASTRSGRTTINDNVKHIITILLLLIILIIITILILILIMITYYYCYYYYYY